MTQMPGNDPNAAIPPQPAAPAPAGAPGKDDCMMAMLAHLLGIFTGFVGALIIWLVKKDTSPFVNDQGKEALNFQITIAIGWVATVVIGFIPFVQLITCLLWPALMVVNIVFCIIACMKANKGEAYRYPFAIRLIK